MYYSDEKGNITRVSAGKIHEQEQEQEQEPHIISINSCMNICDQYVKKLKRKFSRKQNYNMLNILMYLIIFYFIFLLFKKFTENKSIVIT